MPPEVFELPLTGPVYDRGVALAREAVTSLLHADGPAGLHSLEPILTEMANDRRVGGVTALLLASMAAAASLLAAGLELGVDEEDTRSPAALEAAEALVEALCDPARGAGGGALP